MDQATMVIKNLHHSILRELSISKLSLYWNLKILEKSITKNIPRKAKNKWNCIIGELVPGWPLLVLSLKILLRNKRPTIFRNQKTRKSNPSSINQSNGRISVYLESLTCLRLNKILMIKIFNKQKRLPKILKFQTIGK